MRDQNVGRLKTGMSLTLLKQGVYFPGNDEPIKLLIGLSAADADWHIGAIQALSELLCEGSTRTTLNSIIRKTISGHYQPRIITLSSTG